MVWAQNGEMFRHFFDLQIRATGNIYFPCKHQNIKCFFLIWGFVCECDCFLFFFPELSKRFEQPSAPNFLCSSYRAATPQMHQHHVSLSVEHVLWSKTLYSFFKLPFFNVFIFLFLFFSVLRDTLLLIEKQPGALGSHTEHFYSSIMFAMDSLSQSTLGQQSRVEDPGLVGVNGST